MSAWVPAGGGGAASGGRQFFSGGQGVPSSLGSVYSPTSSGGGQAQPPMPSSPGVISINPLDPAGSAGAAGQNFGDLFAGLRAGLFGTDKADAQGHHGGFIGDIPVLGDVARGASGIPGGAMNVVAEGVNRIGGALERLPSGSTQLLDEQWNAIPEDFRKTYQDKIDAEHGLLGTGIFDNDAHWKAAAIRAYAEDQQVTGKPSLFGARFKPDGSLADDITNLFDLLGASSDLVQRGVAGAAKPGSMGLNRLGVIMAVGDGKAAFASGDAKLTPVEQLTYAKVKSGEWNQSEALDFLTTHGSGYSHDGGLQLAGTLALDPLNAAAFGGAAIAKLGETGATFLGRAELAASKLREAQSALEVATAEAQAAKGAAAIKAASSEVERLTGEVDTLQGSVEAFNQYTATSAPRGINVLARAAQGSEKAAAALKFAGKAYEGLDGTFIGRAAKVTRTLIDPLHAIDLGLPGGARMVDLYSDSLPRALIDTLDPIGHEKLLQDFQNLDRTGALRDQFTRDIATATTNRGREGIADLHRGAQLNAGLGEKLMQTLPGDVIDEAVKAAKAKDLLRWLRFDVTKNVLIPKARWTEQAFQSLGQQLESLYHVRSAADWVERFKGMSEGQLSILKFAAYGNSNRRLLSAVANSATHASAAEFPLNRMVLLAKATLTKLGGESLLHQVEKARSTSDAVTLIREWQGRYPQLRNIVINEADPARSVEEFTAWLTDGLDRLPMQVTRDELKQMHPDMQELQDTLGDGYSLGFRPEDQFLWGLERSNKIGGAYAVTGPPWVDHVADGGLGFRGGLAPRLNLIGNPIVNAPFKGTAKVLDYLDVGKRILAAQISGAQIGEIARQKFIAEAGASRFAEGGLSEGVAGQWWEAIQQFTRDHQGYSGPRGFADGDLYNALFGKGLIPQPLLNGATRLTERDVMQMVLNAYDGDLRYIGLTQKLSGRAKAFLHAATGSNFTGQIAEHAWPLLKFRYNPIFQLQEKIEPWVLNAQRGISFATGTKASAADLATESLLQRMTDTSIIRQADLDQAEFSTAVLQGKVMGQAFATPGTKMAKMQSLATSIMDVQGVKRLNMLRTFRAGLGKELRGVWDKAQPGVWDDMKATADVRAGRILDEDEFALQLMGEQLFSNDILIPRLAAAAKQLPDFRNAIKTGEWIKPTSLGDLRPLDLDHVAQSLGIPGVDGNAIQNLADLRRLVGDPLTGDKALKDVVSGLRGLGADPDYITRVQNALTFSWTGFWKTAAERFSLTSEDGRALQDMVAQAAELRGMAPADFISQLFDPMIKDGTEGVLGSLSNAKKLRSVLAGEAGTSTREDLVRQMANVFADYLDPSAKRALLMEFRPELRQAVLDGKVRLDLADLQGMWDSEAANQLGDRIIGYMDGKLGTGAHDVVTDEARGVKAIRAGSVRYMQKAGVEPHAERRFYQLDQQLSDETARAYTALPETPYERTGRKPNFKMVNEATLDLKPKPDGVSDATYEAYRDFVIDTRKQWDMMIAPPRKGGLGIKVTFSKKDPYPDSAAMRADVAKGRLKVFAGESDHPLMTNEQNAMFRAVHDVFGHAAEGFEFGPRGELNASIKHSQMYSDTGRPAMLTETHGQNSYVNFSDELVPQPPLEPPKTYEEAKAAFQKVLGPDVQKDVVMSEAVPSWRVEQALGSGFDELAQAGHGERARDVLNALTDLRTQFPDQPGYLHVPLIHVDSLDFTTALPEYRMTGGLTIGVEGGDTSILFNHHSVTRAGEGFDPIADVPQGGEIHLDGEPTTLRQSVTGAPFAIGNNSWDSLVYHEFGHVVDSAVRYAPGTETAAHISRFGDYFDFADRFDMSTAAKQLSEYANTSDNEAMAELFAAAFDPAIDRTKFPLELQRAIDQYRQTIDDLGIRVPPPPAAAAGKTVRELNAAKPGSVYAPQKAALLPQGLLDQFGEQFVGVGKHVESNPDVARTAQMFGKWSSKVIEGGLLHGADSPFAGLLHDAAGLPTHEAVPYNLTEALLMQQATASMADKWRDAYRLQYFAQERSMLERSINHPMFGLYPASYMWGKLGPEIVRFVAQKPFGVRTGGLAHTLTDAQAQIALQREYDPAFDAHIEKLGHSQALSFAGYMLPTLPWDITASAPIWMKDIAQQGQRSLQSVAGGGPAMPLDQSGKPTQFNALKPTTDVLSKLNPLETTLPWLSRAVGEVTSDKQDLQSAVQQPVQAAELGTPLALVMQELREALAK